MHFYIYFSLLANSESPVITNGPAAPPNNSQQNIQRAGLQQKTVDSDDGNVISMLSHQINQLKADNKITTSDALTIVTVLVVLSLVVWGFFHRDALPAWMAGRSSANRVSLKDISLIWMFMCILSKIVLVLN